VNTAAAAHCALYVSPFTARIITFVIYLQ